MDKKVFGASLLVAGTAIGAGMLALPVASAASGFFPSIFTFAICYLFMLATGLLLLEACMWLPKDVNMISLSKHLLGSSGRAVSWLLYLFLFYCLNIAYISAGGGLVVSLFPDLSPTAGILLFLMIFAPFVYFGTKAVDGINRWLMLGLIVSYIALISLGIGYIEKENLLRQNWSTFMWAFPVVFTSFSYQGIVPSLVSYLNQDFAKAKKAIILGITIPFIFYLFWQFLVVGIIPYEGPWGLLHARLEGKSVLPSLKQVLETPIIYVLSQAFSFFALTTSFLSVSLGLGDFLADGFKVTMKGKSKLAVLALVFIPPTIIALSQPGIFLKALGYAGGIGCALLLGLMPILMVWQGRYEKKLAYYPHRLWGGKGLLTLMAALVLFEVVIEFMIEVF